FARVPMVTAVKNALEKAQVSLSLLDSYDLIAVSEDTSSTDRDKGSDLVRDFAASSERAKKIDWGNLRRALGMCETRGEKDFVVYEYVAEPFLGDDYRSASGDKSVPVFIMDHPAAVSPLARRKDGDQELVDRFELFVDSRE